MDRETFWQIVEDARPKNNDPDRHCDALRRRLKKLTPEEIIAFERVFSELSGECYRADLWDVIGAIDGGCSDDGFMDFRAWLVMQGRDVFETVLESPEYLAEITLEDCVMSNEEANYVAMQAYDERTGVAMPDDESNESRPLRLKGRFVRAESGFRCKYPMVWRLLNDPPEIDRAWLKWKDGTVKKMARAIHDGRRWDELPVLADALEEAGCEEPFILTHLREGKRHARSCWVTNFLLGRR